jgi:tetratricopeptide (TPR) repeat protein
MGKNKMKKAVLVLFFGLLYMCVNAADNGLNQNLDEVKKLKRAYKNEEALQLINVSLMQAQTSADKLYEAKFLLAKADHLLSLNQVDSIDYFYEKAGKIFEGLRETGDWIRARTGLLELARRTNPGSTMDQYLQLLKDARELGDNEVYYFVMDKLITLNYAMENYEDAIAMNHECIQYYRSTNDSLALAIKLKGLGNLYFSSTMDSAMFYLRNRWAILLS